MQGYKVDRLDARRAAAAAEDTAAERPGQATGADGSDRPIG